MAQATRAEWERRFLSGLQEEWEMVRWELPREHARALQPPTFALSDTESTWGRWRGRPLRQIEISRRLVWNHPWFAVVEVLRHEIAHQVAEELLAASGETPHGPRFQQACRWLHVSHRASGTYPTLDQIVANDGELPENDRVLVRIKKLLALAESPNPHEAELALTKAREMMARHNVDLLDHAGKREYVTIRLGEAKRRHQRDAYVLSGILGEFYLVHPVWASGYDPVRDATGKVLEISGTPTNVRLAHYVYDYLQQYCDWEWQRFSRRRRLGGTARRDFTIGILLGFAEKLRSSERESPELQALVKQGDFQLDQYFAERYPRLRTRRSSALTCQTEALEEGQRRGKDLTIHPGVERGNQPRRIGRGAG
jgi:hypothetical protein